VSGHRETFAHLWFSEWRFDCSGAPEDVASYLEEVLRAIAEPKATGNEFLESIGKIDGQQKFIFQWLRSVGLVERNLRGELVLTTKGRDVMGLLNSEVFYQVFGFDD
jgi:hypothetical protein